MNDMSNVLVTREHVVPLPSAGERVVLFAAFNRDYAPLADIARPNWKAYCERHGYGLRFYPDGYHTDPTRPEPYGDKGRFNWYYDLCGFADIVMYLDIDTLIMNPEIRVTDRLWPEDRFVWTYDESGPLSGVWIARTDALTEKHLRYTYEYAVANNNVRNGLIEPNGISDQDAMTRLMHIPPFDDTYRTCVDAKSFGHCYESNYEPGDWLITFPGMSRDEKLAKMEQYAQVLT